MWGLVGHLRQSSFAYCIFLIVGIIDGVSIKHRHLTYPKSGKKLLPPFSNSSCGLECLSSPVTSDSMPTNVPDLLSLSEENQSMTTEVSMTTTLSTNISDLFTTRPVELVGRPIVITTNNFDDLTSLLRQKIQKCRKSREDSTRPSLSTLTTFTCEKLKMSSWLMSELERNFTDLIPSYIQLVRNVNSTYISDETELLPEPGLERVFFRLISSFGEPVDKLLFYQVKKYTKSRHLKVTVPHLVTVELEPRTHPEVVTGRTLFDPGFNMKLKFPFFHDELKVAVSTGPSFLAGLGVGLVVLGIKSIFAPFILAMKAVILSWFFKDMSPVDFVKAMTVPMLPTWMTGWRPEPEPHFTGWQQSIHNYEPPRTHNSHDWGEHTSKDQGKTTGLMGALSHLLPFTSQGEDQSYQYSNSNPSSMFESTRPSGPSGPPPPPPPSAPYRQSHYDGRHQFSRPNTLESSGGQNDDDDEVESPPEDTGYKSYFPPTAPSPASESTDNMDPFYSPLLSRIDSIFMHLGFNEEGCKERAVCSIYKFPVKYAPYSNLLSAQLSKHQSELKRPVNTSPKVLRYFKYMKAAKDGQAALNCLELYPNCSNDTEKLTNLPMVKTFQQLTELMGTTGPNQ